MQDKCVLINVLYQESMIILNLRVLRNIIEIYQYICKYLNVYNKN